MRAFARAIGVVLVLRAFVSPGSAAAHGPSKPVVMVRPHWRLVVRKGLLSAAVGKRYVAFLAGPGGRVILLDEWTGTRRVLAPPSCAPQVAPQVDSWNTSGQPL